MMMATDPQQPPSTIPLDTLVLSSAPSSPSSPSRHAHNNSAYNTIKDDGQHLRDDRKELDRLNPSNVVTTPPTGSVMSATTLDPRVNQTLLRLLCAQSAALVFFVVLPVLINLPYISKPWLNAGDLWKIFDPLFTCPLLYFILDIALECSATTVPSPESDVSSGGVTRPYSPLQSQYRLNSRNCRYRFIFLVCLAIYVEGHGIHTAATIFKDPLKYLMTTQPQSAEQYPLIRQAYSYIRDDWEHIYSHYIYLVGALGCSVMHMLAYRRIHHPPLCRASDWILYWIAALLYGVMFAGIAVNFPFGLYLCFVWLVIYAVPWCVWLFRQQSPDPVRSEWRQRMLFQPGFLLIPQFYLLSYAIGLVIVIIYICIFGFRDRASAGISLS